MVANKIDLCSTLSIEKEKYLPRYLKELPMLTVGTRSWLMISLGKILTDEVEDFLIPNEEHLSILIVISAQLHHLEKWFSKS